MSNFEPPIAICMTCKNAELTIENCIDSVMKLNYPKEKLVWIIVDSQSSDNTRELISSILSKNNVKNFIINKKCNISEGRNICIEKGFELSLDYFFFIDSDTFILDYDILRYLISLSEKDLKSVFFIDVKFKNFSNKEEMENFISSIKLEQKERDNYKDKYILKGETWRGTGMFFCNASILKNVRFYEGLSFFEDCYFGYELNEKGYNVKSIKSYYPIALDLNVVKHSDIYVKMPVRDYLSALNKKSFSLAYQYCKHNFVSSLITFIKSEEGIRGAFHALYAMLIFFGFLIGLTFDKKIGGAIAVFGIALLASWMVRMRIRRCKTYKETFSCLFKYAIFYIYNFFYVPIVFIVYKNKFKKILLKINTP